MRINRIVGWFLSAVVLTVALGSGSSAQIGIGISVRVGPPPLPVYVQPLCPGPGYIWTPGYWAWDDDDGYYWVPGTWVLAPVGMLWTPGYWGWNDGVYVWNDGYWGPHIGFYGGINYGFGYTGDGFYGGYWEGDRFFYNRSVNNVNVTNITNVYNKTVIVNNNTHVSYNGGNGGVRARPTPQQEAAIHERHVPAVGPQVQHQQAARNNRQLFASVNHGRPAVAATSRPADFSRGVPARAAGGAYHPPKISPKEAVANRAGGQNRTSGEANVRSTQPNRSQVAPSRNSARFDVSRGTTSAARPNENRTTANRPSENRPPRESRPLASSGSVSPRTENAPVRHNDRAPSSSRAPISTRRESVPPPRESRPARRDNAPPREAAPARRESPPPQRQAAPQRRESAPPQRSESAPRRETAQPPNNKESAPKQERRPPGKGR